MVFGSAVRSLSGVLGEAPAENDLWIFGKNESTLLATVCWKLTKKISQHSSAHFKINSRVWGKTTVKFDFWIFWHKLESFLGYIIAEILQVSGCYVKAHWSKIGFYICIRIFRDGFRVEALDSNSRFVFWKANHCTELGNFQYSVAENQLLYGKNRWLGDLAIWKVVGHVPPLYPSSTKRRGYSHPIPPVALPLIMTGRGSRGRLC